MAKSKGKKSVEPIDSTVSKAIITSVGILGIAIGVLVFASAYTLATYDFSTAVYGIAIVWIACIVFFFGVITEEHTLKELFLRQAYFFCGLLVMILGVLFVSVAGLSTTQAPVTVMEFGVLLLILGGALIVFSAQKAGDYSKRSAFFAIIAGILLIPGGIMAGSDSVALGGIFVVIVGALWLGLRSAIAE